jgi:hypothetical protein
MPTELRWCPSCRAERVFEMPPCPDEHGGDCPERACVDCGEAVLIGLTLVGDLIAPASPVLDAPAPDSAGVDGTGRDGAGLDGTALVVRTAVRTAAA